MPQSEKRDGSAKPRRAKSNGAKSNGHDLGKSNASIQEIVKLGRDLSERVQRDMETHPEALLVAVGSASFVAGAVLGSRLGRFVLSVAIPLGIQHLVASEVSPRIRTYVEELLRNDETPVA
jgi:hypothetical protein